MTALVLSALSRATPRTDNQARVTALLFLAAVLIRLPHFGNPAFMIDEQFYLLAGDRLLHGALPYVDIWDRKPIGLFLLYAFARLFGGDGFVQYQLLATLFAGGTAALILRIARPVAGLGGGSVAGLLYLLWIEIAEGGGGQSPVFYNLFTAGAAALVLEAARQPDWHGFSRRAYPAMALVGLAIQVKYTAAVEGLFFGLVLAWHAVRRAGPVRAAATSALLALVALGPTLAALGVYAAIGHARDFWFANFTSIFLREPTEPGELHYRCWMAALRLVPFTFCAALAAWQLRGDGRATTRAWQLFMLGWMAAALAGYLSVGVLYSHYILPVFLPFAIAAAPIFPRWPTGPVLALLAAWLPASHLDYPDFATTERHRREIAALTALIPAQVTDDCLQMFDGPPILYFTTRACAPSRFVFPDHLSAAIEAHAIGVDPVAEIGRLIARRPLAITISPVDVRPPNHAAFAAMHAALGRFYHLAGSAPHDGRPIQVWVRNP